MSELIDPGLLTGFLIRQRLARARGRLRGRVLDFGCGVGSLTALCRPEAYLGVDTNPRMLAVARRTLPRYAFTTEVGPDERFDTVAALAFIEHVPDPAYFLGQFRGWLRPGGRVVLTTPHPSMEFLHTYGARVGLFSAAAHEEHEELLDLDRMAEVADKAGMEVTGYSRFLLGANQLFVLEPG